MGNNQSSSSSRFSSWDSQRLEQMTGVPQKQLIELHQEFQRTAGRDGLMDESEFRRLYSQLGMGSGNNNEINRAFRLFDRDRSGKLSFDEFVSTVVMTNPNTNTNNRLNHLIEAHNPTSGYITPEYGRQVFSSMNQYYGTNTDPDEMWDALDDGSGRVPQEQFVQYISQSPAYARHINW